jgi:catechol 2,3-dioxygenase-like lactoylglutathione lyase family enzyme
MSGIHHTAIVTADVERSMRFWCDGLGFTELFDHTFTGDWPTLFTAGTDRLRSVFLGDPDTPDAGIVELVQFEGAAAASPPPDAPAFGFFLHRRPASTCWCVSRPRNGESTVSA